MNKLEKAQELEQQGKHKRVDELLKEILTTEPNNSDVMFMLAKSKLNQNELEEGYLYINKALEFEENNSEFLIVKGSIEIRKNKNKKAQHSLKKALKENPNSYQAQILMGYIYYNIGNNERAKDYFTLANKVDSSSPEANTNIARILLEEGNIEEALKTLFYIEKNYKKRPNIYLLIGQALIEKEAYSLAEEYLNKIKKDQHDYSIAKIYNGIAKTFLGKTKEAETIIYDFNKQNKNSREGFAAIGLIYYKSKQFNQAIQYLGFCIKSGKHPASWEVAYVESLAAIGERLKAIEFYNRSTDNKGRNSRFRLAELYELEGKASDAIVHYKQIKETESKYILAQIGIARCSLYEQEYKQVEKASKEALKINEQNPEANLLLINSFLFQDKQKPAIKTLRKLDYNLLNNVYKKTFRVIHGLILDNQQKYKKAMSVFLNEEKKEEQFKENSKTTSNEELSKAQKLSIKKLDKNKDPVFIIGSFETSIVDFAFWLNKQNVDVLIDRLITTGREDVYSKEEKHLIDDDKNILKERMKYFKLRDEKTNKNEEKADCLYMDINNAIKIKKYFPNSHVVLLTRDSLDIWLGQKVFGRGAVKTDEWAQLKNQIISLGLKVTQVDIDKWLVNDKETIKKIGGVFNKKLKRKKDIQTNYWQKASFEKGHWKNYKQFIGQ